MPLRRIYLLVLPFTALLLGACDNDLPPCTPADLIPPVLDSPGSYVNVGTGPTTGSLTPELFQWSFEEGCVPDHFKLRFSPDRYFGIARAGMTDGELTWPDPAAPYPQLPLDPGTEYFWTVRAWTDGVNGPDAPTQVFFTGPLCGTSAELVAPDLYAPDPGEILDTPFAELHFRPGEPKCIPDGYFVDLQTDTNFTGTQLLGEFLYPGNYLFTDELEDCTTYYWRVAAIEGGVQGPFSETRAFSISIAPNCMISAVPEPEIPLELIQGPCTYEDLVEPVLLAPLHYENVGAGVAEGPYEDALLQWEYPGQCFPDHYVIKLAKDPNFSYGLAFWNAPDLDWGPADINQPLERATQYWWSVAAASGYPEYQGEPYRGPYAAPRSFFTGPACASTTELTAPELIFPSDGFELHSLVAELRYTPGDPGCIPEGYFIDLQTDPAFGGATLLQEYDFPGTTVYTDPLNDCTLYYWRVAAVFQGSYGPYSETRSFFTNEAGNCAIPLAPPMAEALKDLPCWQGPHPDDYPIVGYILQGETSPIAAQDLSGQWWYIENPDGPFYCAVRKADTKVIGDVSGVHIWNDPEIEEPAPVCKPELSQEKCKAAGGTWYQPTRGGEPYCKCD